MKPIPIETYITTFRAAADALQAVRDLGDLTPSAKRAYTKRNQNATTAARIQARVHKSTRKLVVTAKPKYPSGKWTPARRKAHGAKMRALWAQKKGTGA